MQESLQNAAKNPLACDGSMFRAMKEEADGLPKIGRSSRELGIRIEGPIRDLPVGEDGTVEPGTGGMSVALDAARNLPKPRLPRSLGGEGRDSVFTMPKVGVPATLHPRVDRYPHALVEPIRRCSLLEFESDLASTRSFWSKFDD